MMSSESDFNKNQAEIDLVLCPFAKGCVLNKIDSCKAPDFCNCHEYQSKKKKLFTPESNSK